MPLPAAVQDVFHLIVVVDASDADHWLRGPGGVLVVIVAGVDGLALHSEADDLEGCILAFAASADQSKRYLQLSNLVNQILCNFVVSSVPFQLVDCVGERGRHAAVLLCSRMQWLRLFFSLASIEFLFLGALRGFSALLVVLCVGFLDRGQAGV